MTMPSAFALLRSMMSSTLLAELADLEADPHRHVDILFDTVSWRDRFLRSQGDVRHLRAQGDKMVAEQAPDTGVLKTAEMVGLGTRAVQRLKREMAAAA
jgi:hypothetical protein